MEMEGSKATVSCSIPTCRGRVKPMHHFPHPTKYPAKFKAWVEAACNPNFEGLNDIAIFKKGFMCFRHFEANAIITGTTRLRKNAIPTLNLPTRASKSVAAQEININTVAGLRGSTTIDIDFTTPVKEFFRYSMQKSPRKRITPSKWGTTKGFLSEKLSPRTTTTSSRNGSIHVLSPSKRGTSSNGAPAAMMVSRKLDFGITPFQSERESNSLLLPQLSVDEPLAVVLDLPQTSFTVESNKPASSHDFAAPGPSGLPKSSNNKIASSIPFAEGGPSDLNKSGFGVLTSETCKRTPGPRKREEPLAQRLSLNTAAFTETEKKLYRKALQLQRRIARLQRQHKTDLHKLTAVQNISKDESLRNVIEDMSPVQRRFFESQIRNTGRKPQGREFTEKEKADAIAIWKNGPRTYKLLSSMFAMPSIRTLQNTLNKVSLEPGISESIFEVLRRQVERMRRPKHKLCTLMFDEIAIQPHLDYLPHEDKVVGFEDDGTTRTREIADHVCVFMLRGIFGRWKQPVAFALCKSSMKAANIVRFYKEIVKRATEIGLNVIASVCDQGATNRSAINSLIQETKRECSSKGEEVKDNVIVIHGHTVIPLFDPPHLLKSIRNNLLTKELKFKLDDGKWKTARWAHFEKAYDFDQRRRWRSMKKITADHVYPKCAKKMKVRLASQVFSHSVATFMDLLADPTHGSLPTESRDTAELFKFLDNIFDSVNGGFGDTSGKVLRGMVTRKSCHRSWWLKGKRVFAEMEFIPSKDGDKAKPPVLDGWCRTLDGFLQIKETLRKLGCKSFPARAFNQDPIENFFGQIRQYGVRYTNPTCAAFVPFYKSLLIRNFSSYHARGSNCEQDDNSFLVTISDYLQQHTTNRQNVVDRWRPPSVSEDNESELFDQYVLGYVGGFLLKRENFQCNVCERNFEHVGEPDPLYHKLVELREFGTDRKRLKYMNVILIKDLIKIHNHLKILIPSAIYSSCISQRIISHLRRSVDFSFQGCGNCETEKDRLFKLFVRISIFAYMKRLSNIVYGKQAPESTNQLEISLQKLCRSVPKT